MHNSSWRATFISAGVFGLLQLLPDSCTYNSPTATKELQTAEERVDGEIDLGGGTAVYARNQVGPVFVNGEGLGPKIRWFMNKSANAATLAEARSLLRNISLSGDLRISNAGRVTVLQHSGNCRISSSGGDIGVQIVLPEQGACTVSTSSGNISIVLPVDASARVSCITGDGLISVAGLTLSDLHQTTTSLTGVLGSGMGKIQLSTGQGNIEIKAP